MSQGSPWSRDGVRMLPELRAGPAGGGTTSAEMSSVASLLNLSHLRKARGQGSPNASVLSLCYVPKTSIRGGLSDQGDHALKKARGRRFATCVCIATC